MKTNDLKAGTRIQLRNGWYGTIADNARGTIRMAEVEGIYTETGSVYSQDIVFAKNAAGAWEPVEHTPAQLKLRENVERLF